MKVSGSAERTLREGTWDRLERMQRSEE